MSGSGAGVTAGAAGAAGAAGVVVLFSPISEG